MVIVRIGSPICCELAYNLKSLFSPLFPFRGLLLEANQSCSRYSSSLLQVQPQLLLPLQQDLSHAAVMVIMVIITGIMVIITGIMVIMEIMVIIM